MYAIINFTVSKETGSVLDSVSKGKQNSTSDLTFLWTKGVEETLAKGMVHGCILS